MKEMRDCHKKFVKGASDCKVNLRECIARMALELDPPEGTEGMDRQLFDFGLNEENEKIIIALNPVARQALLGFH